VSFCAKGVKKLNATQFEVRASDYVPDGALRILIVRQPPPR